MIVVTGGTGFIGSAFVWELNEAGIDDIVVIDDLGSEDKWKNLAKRRVLEIVPIDKCMEWLEKNEDRVSLLAHLGACSSTTEQDGDFLFRRNVQASVDIWHYCVAERVPLIYASSAATYGAGLDGYSDHVDLTPRLVPLNKYGYSKLFFDKWVLRQEKTPPFWAGLRYFNVFGANEYHKGAQASVVSHAYRQAMSGGPIKLFKSYRDGVEHGEQKRDFIYIKDVMKVMLHFAQNHESLGSGFYNVGTGEARSFLDLAKGVLRALGKPEDHIEWIEMPEQVRKHYQYFTEAELDTLRGPGRYQGSFYNLEDSVHEYVTQYLANEDPYL